MEILVEGSAGAVVAAAEMSSAPAIRSARRECDRCPTLRELQALAGFVSRLSLSAAVTLPHLAAVLRDCASKTNFPKLLANILANNRGRDTLPNGYPKHF